MKRPYSLVLILLAIVLLTQPACFWRKPKPIQERTFDVYGTVKSVSADKLVIAPRGKNTEETFAITDASVKGSEFAPGALVHVYYKINDKVKEITLVVEKIKK